MQKTLTAKKMGTNSTTRRDITVGYRTSSSQVWETIVININPQVFISCDTATIDKSLISNIENSLVGSTVIEVQYAYTKEQAKKDLGITD